MNRLKKILLFLLASVKILGFLFGMVSVLAIIAFTVDYIISHNPTIETILAWVLFIVFAGISLWVVTDLIKMIWEAIHQQYIKELYKRGLYK